MFISEKELDSRVNSPRNLLQILNINREDYPDSGDSVDLILPDLPDSDNSSFPVPSISGDSDIECTTNDDEGTSGEKNLEVRAHRFRGRNFGDKNLPEVMRNIIAIESNQIGPSATAREFGVTVGTACNLGKGLTPNGTQRNEKVHNVLNQRMELAKEKAVDRLLESLVSLDADRISGAKAKDIAGIAKDMAGIIEKMTPKQESTGASKLVILAPNVKTESGYDVIEIS